MIADSSDIKKEISIMQPEQNPDVNSTVVDDDYPAQRNPGNTGVPPNGDVEREPIPVPPDVEDPYPVIDPPMVGDYPLVDVDDSPTRIAND